MKAAMGSKNFVTVALSVMVVLLMGLLYWEWSQGVRLERDLVKMRKIPVTPVQTKAILTEFVLPEAETGFPELISRSLFTASRRATASSVKRGIVAMKKGQFVLVGVLITPVQKSALLRDVQTKKTETVAQAGLIRGLTLGEVEPTRVVLRQGAESEELNLDVQIGSSRPIPALPGAALVPAPASTAVKASAPASPPASAPVLASSVPVLGGAVKPAGVASGPKGPAPVHVDTKK